MSLALNLIPGGKYIFTFYVKNKTDILNMFKVSIKANRAFQCTLFECPINDFKVSVLIHNSKYV